jgi:putative hydrolase of the HAD superfamily
LTYKNIFFDLDDTLWAFVDNARDVFEEMYHKYGFDRFFRSFPHFYDLYKRRNAELWVEYGDGRITKEELNRQRFSYPLQQVGVDDEALVSTYSADFLSVIPTKQKLMPHAREVLDYLLPKYRLFILSNGFRELQARKMESAGIASYFRRVILSEDIGVLKPHTPIFHYALTVTQSDAEDSIMIGDGWDSDIVGAYRIGMPQIYYNPLGHEFPRAFAPTHEIRDLRELTEIL